MKILIKILILVSFVQSYAFGTAKKVPPNAWNESIQKYQTSKTFLQFYNAIKPQLQPSYYELLLSKSEPFLNSALPKMSRINDKEIQLEINGALIPIAMDGSPIPDFYINRKKVSIDLTLSAEENFSRIQAALPHKSTSLMKYFIPEAQAAVVLLASVVAAGAAINLGLFASLISTRTCIIILHETTTCISSRSAITSNQTTESYRRTADIYNEMSAKLEGKGSDSEKQKGQKTQKQEAESAEQKKHVGEIYHSMKERQASPQTKVIVGCNKEIDEHRFCSKELAIDAKKFLGIDLESAPSQQKNEKAAK